jgi:hypothetical protein
MKTEIIERLMGGCWHGRCGAPAAGEDRFEIFCALHNKPLDRAQVADYIPLCAAPQQNELAHQITGCDLTGARSQTGDR